MSKYLFIGSHTDDVELSCGGTMRKLVYQGHEVHHLAMSYCGSKQLTVESMKSADVLGIQLSIAEFTVREFHTQRKQIADYLYNLRGVDFVFTHSKEDRHSDHRTIGEESLRVFNCNLITYLSPWNGSHSENYFVEISELELENKIKALSCYHSQNHRAYMDPNFILAQARYNGIKCGKLYAEAFKSEKLII